MTDQTEADIASARSISIAGVLRQTVLPPLISGIGAALVIWSLAALSMRLDWMLLIAPFGASCVLLFALPQSPLARPQNVILGHLLSTTVGLLVLVTVGDGALALGLAVGLAIALMQLTGTLHPPAGADPLVVIMAGAGWSFLLTPVLVGAVALVLAAWAYHRFVSGRAYPG